MGTMRLFKVWSVIGLIALSGSSLAFAQSNIHESGGNVGIGTTTPGTNLHVTSGSATKIAVNNTNAGSFSFSIQGGSGASRLAIGTDDGSLGVTERVTVMAEGVTAGNVGIGTTNPAVNLHIKGTAADASYRVEGGTNNSGYANYRNGSSNMYTGVEDSAGGNLLNGATAFAGVLGMASSHALQFGTGGAVKLTISAGGNVGIGTASPTAKLQVAGDAVFDGTVTGGNIAAKYQDIAEWVPAKSSLPAGTVVVIDPLQGNGVLPASQAYDTRIAGVVSAQPGILLGEEGENKVKVAHSGRVRVKVDAQFGSISVGDMLVSSGTAGYAMHSTPVEVGGIAIHRPGTIVGKALEPLTEGQGEILVLLTLQ